MNLIDQIAEVSAAHRMGTEMTFYRNGACKLPRCRCGKSMHPNAHPRHLAEAVAEVVRPRIDTQAELDALPAGSVVSIGRGCGLYEKDQAGDWGWPDNDYPFREAEHSGEDVILLYTPGDTE